jgi:putative ABC transport system ATP-binding protein
VGTPPAEGAGGPLRAVGALGSSLVELQDVERVFHRGPAEVVALRNVTLRIQSGEFVAVVGPSGSGKTTLLSILGCLDRPSGGTYFLGGSNVVALDDISLSRIRNRNIGFVFQSFHLIPHLTVLENVETPLLYGECPPGETRERALKSLEHVGLAHRAEHRPSELSGGEAQRAAVARALVVGPSLLLADEPTGNLDSATGEQIAALLASCNSQGTTVVLVTHNDALARRARRTVSLKDGAVARDTRGVDS